MASIEFQPPVIAHRGASGYAPENTLIAFEKAVQLGIKWIEFDVMQAACAEVIIFHDETLDRTTNGNGDVGQYPYSYLKTLDAGAWFGQPFAGQRIPTLKQLMQFVAQQHLNVNIELKALHNLDKQLAMRVIKDLSPWVDTDQFAILFSSFSIDALQVLRESLPHCHIGLLLHEWRADWKVICEELRCVSVHVNEAIMTPQIAKEVKRADKLLLCYTVNHLERADELYDWGVDAVFSDTPDKLLR